MKEETSYRARNIISRREKNHLYRFLILFTLSDQISKQKTWIIKKNVL